MVETVSNFHFLLINKLMKFIKIPQQNGKDFHLINLSQIIYVAANDKSGSCKVFLAGDKTISLLPPYSTQLIKDLSKYNQQVSIHLNGAYTEEDW